MRTFALSVALLAVVAPAIADEVDPEPPRVTKGGSFRALKGKWNAVARITGGMENPYKSASSYTFDDDKVTYALSTKKATTRKMTAKLDPKRPGYIELTNDETKAVSKYFYKVEKEKLYLTLDRGSDPKAKADFTGNMGVVLVYEKQGK